eukprot:m.383021 g.383021  ORF g.383021 m.383021 type:complete len:502 (+) comp56256_c0_seq5:110-1615(+)
MELLRGGASRTTTDKAKTPADIFRSICQLVAEIVVQSRVPASAAETTEEKEIFGMKIQKIESVELALKSALGADDSKSQQHDLVLQILNHSSKQEMIGLENWHVHLGGSPRPSRMQLLLLARAVFTHARLLPLFKARQTAAVPLVLSYKIIRGKPDAKLSPSGSTRKTDLFKLESREGLLAVSIEYLLSVSDLPSDPHAFRRSASLSTAAKSPDEGRVQSQTMAASPRSPHIHRASSLNKQHGAGEASSPLAATPRGIQRHYEDDLNAFARSLPDNISGRTHTPARRGSDHDSHVGSYGHRTDSRGRADSLEHIGSPPTSSFQEHTLHQSAFSNSQSQSTQGSGFGTSRLFSASPDEQMFSLDEDSIAKSSSPATKHEQQKALSPAAQKRPPAPQLYSIPSVSTVADPLDDLQFEMDDDPSIDTFVAQMSKAMPSIFASRRADLSQSIVCFRVFVVLFKFAPLLFLDRSCLAFAFQAHVGHSLQEVRKQDIKLLEPIAKSP